MKHLVLTALVLSALALSGCKTLLFESQFDGSGSPAGDPPGNPADDHITVNSPTNPFLSGGKLISHPSGNSVWFYSRPVNDAGNEKSIYWSGQLKFGSAPFYVAITADNVIGTPFPADPLLLAFSKSELKVTNAQNVVLESASLVANGEHRVLISLHMEESPATYHIYIEQVGGPDIHLVGDLPANTVNWIKSRKRILVVAGFIALNGTDEYVMDEMIMREY